LRDLGIAFWDEGMRYNGSNIDLISHETKTTKNYPLRGKPITIASDFDEPLPELWEAIAIV